MRSLIESTIIFCNALRLWMLTVIPTRMEVRVMCFWGVKRLIEGDGLEKEAIVILIEGFMKFGVGWWSTLCNIVTSTLVEKLH